MSVQGVILAAGKGTRIQPFSDLLPKPLLPILGKPLLVWQIEAMRAIGVEQITVVIGHLGHLVARTLGDGSDYGVRLAYVEQQEMLGIAHAVGQLEPHVEEPFLLFLGDIFFETEDLGEMVALFERDGVDAVLAVKPESDRDSIRRNFTVDVDGSGFVRRVIEKPRHPRTDVKGCGLYLFDPAVFDAIRRTPRTALRDEYELTDSIQIFIDWGYGVVPAPIVREDLNLSMPGDLLDLNLHVMREQGHACFIAPGATVEEGAEVGESVVLDGARLAPGARLERCLVLEGQTVPPGVHRRTIFSGGHEVVCE